VLIWRKVMIIAYWTQTKKALRPTMQPRKTKINNGSITNPTSLIPEWKSSQSPDSAAF
jgi:hypothetical protein